MKEIVPVFVMGAPRSGTTFLASSIASHESIIALPEMHYVFRLMEEEMVSGGLSSDEKIKLLKEDFYFCSMDLFDNDDELNEFVEKKDVKQLILGIVQRYNEKHYNKDYDYWVEHSPHSHLYLDMIKYFFPNAKFIHIIRDPRAVYNSTVKELWGFKDIITGAGSWNRSVRDILAKEEIYAIHTLKYEELVADVEKHLKSISEYLGVNYSSSMLSNEGFVVNAYIKAERSFFGVKADKSRSNKWRDSLSSKDIAHINAVSTQIMIRFGYLNADEPRKEIVGIEMYLKRIVGLVKMKFYMFQLNKKVRRKFCAN